jgi:hypothetical protein
MSSHGVLLIVLHLQKQNPGATGNRGLQRSGPGRSMASGTDRKPLGIFHYGTHQLRGKAMAGGVENRL